MTSVLVTRSEEDGARTAEAIAAKGWRPVLAPMIRIRFLTSATPDVDNLAAIAFTSANGARAFAALEDKPEGWRRIPVFAVGKICKEATEALGFENVEAASGTVTSLARLIAREVKPEDGAVLHAVGRAQAGDLAAALEDAGLTARKSVLYDAVAAEALPEEAAALLAAGGLDWATFFSPRTARIFVSLAEEAGLADTLGRVGAACLSPAVAEAAARGAWRTSAVARDPTEDALIAAIERAALP